MDKTAFFERLKPSSGNSAHKTELPNWEAKSVQTLQQPKENDTWSTFKERFTNVHGIALDSLDALVAYIRKESLTTGYIDSGMNESKSIETSLDELKFLHEFDESELDSYQFSITKAAGVIAETGSIILKEKTTSSRLAALAPWIHIAVVSEDSKIYPTLLDAIQDFGNDPYIVFATGPSKTADVEGILIEGVHGPGIQVCCKL